MAAFGALFLLGACDENAPPVVPTPVAQAPLEPDTGNPNPVAIPVTRHTCDLQAPPPSGLPLPAEQSATVGTTFRDCDECPLMIEVPTGTYVRGSPSTEAGHTGDEGPQREITIAYRLAVGVHEVTFEQWDACVADGGCGGFVAFDRDWGRGQRPVIHVHWGDATAYTQWLSGKTGKSYRLLSEAEWEYVARAGTTTPYYVGSAVSASDANYIQTGRGETAPVGAYPSNAWGLRDTMGNVWEWTRDCYCGSYEGAPVDGSPRTQGECHVRILRGGSFANGPPHLRMASRSFRYAEVRKASIGFRVARALDP